MAIIAGTNNKDYLPGTNYDDRISGRGDDDTLYGFDGDDLLNGGYGADYMNGGIGDDYYWVDNVNDTVYEFNSASYPGGKDTVLSFLESYTLPANVENLQLYQYGLAISGNGNELSNEITGNRHNNSLSGMDGNDTLKGEGGKDNLFGGGHSDYLVGGDGDDQLVGTYSSNGTQVEYDTLRGDGGADTFYISSYYGSYYLNNGYAYIEDFDRLEGDKFYAGGASSNKYTLIQNRNFGGGSALDTQIYYNGNLVAVAEDTINVSIANDFIFS